MQRLMSGSGLPLFCLWKGDEEGQAARTLVGGGPEMAPPQRFKIQKSVHMRIP